MDESNASKTTKRPWWRRMGWWWIAPVAILLMGAGAAYYFLVMQPAATTTASRAAATYNTTRVTRGNVSITAAGTGSLIADPQINLAFSIAGRVGKLNVKVGDQVKTGDALAQLDSTEQLQANIANIQLQILQDQQAIDTLNKNAAVSLATAYQTLTADQKAYDDAQTANLRTAYARCSDAVNTKNAEALQNALDKLNTQAQSNLTGATITAPSAGTVISIAANQGEVVDTSTYIILADLSQSKVQVQINEPDMNKMAVGNKAQIVFDALPKQTFTGKVIQINPALTTSGETTVVTGLIALDQIPLNPINNHLLPLGLNSSVTIINNQAKDALIVSADALRDLGDGTYGVFVQGQNQKLLLKPVQVGINDTINVEIKSGLNLGDVVSTGSARAAQ